MVQDELIIHKTYPWCKISFQATNSAAAAAVAAATADTAIPDAIAFTGAAPTTAPGEGIVYRKLTDFYNAFSKT